MWFRKSVGEILQRPVSVAADSDGTFVLNDKKKEIYWGRSTVNFLYLRDYYGNLGGALLRLGHT